MARRTTSRKKGKTKEPEWGWQNVAVWERTDGALSGNLKLTPAFLEEVYARIEEGEIDLDDDGYFNLSIYMRENDSSTRNAPAFFGSITIPEPREDEPKRRKSRRRDDDEDDEPTSRRRSSRRRDDDDDEDEAPARRRRRRVS